ncbi:hypothetical protein C6P45_002663 [Maudiozyma exigua]|uniref:PA14 domain-containing protein n=1 Tax=Maudiozyma exigua TaxID=34358 RepID=A0A9P7B2V3_MAUEX|nr:hypothetical protein C6P45_002663 [Kazachstania exigua]
MTSVIITLITILLFNIVSAQIPTYPECTVIQYTYDESGSGMSMIEFGVADLDNTTPGSPTLSKWEYLQELTVVGDKGITLTSTLNFDISTGGDPNTVVKGKVYGYPMTVSNFTFATNGLLVVPKSGYYTFNIAASEGALMRIIQANDAYCCDPGDAEVDDSFYVANLQSDPEHNLLENSIYLLAGFRYLLTAIYFNSNGGDASFHITMTDPDGVKYDDIGPFVQRLTGSDDYCSYQNVISTTTIEWQSSTTATSLKYITSTDVAGSKVIESLYVVQVPSSTPIPSSSSEIENSSITELPSSSTVGSSSSSEPVTSSTVETSSEPASESFSSSVVISSVVSSESEAPSTSFSESRHSSTLESSTESTNIISSQSSSYSEEKSSTSATSLFSESVTESSDGSSETPSSTTGEISSFSTLDSQSETFKSSSSAVVSHSEDFSSSTISLPSITSTSYLGESESSSLLSETAGSSSEVNTVSSGGNENEDSSSNENNELQTTHYITETSVIRTTITTLCSTPTLYPEASVPSLDIFTSTYVSEFTTTVTLTSCAPGTCQVGNSQTRHQTTEIQGECTHDCVTTTTEWESSTKNIIIGTKNPISIDDSKVTSSKKPDVAVISGQSSYDSTTSHTVIQNVNMSSHITYDVFMFIFSMLMSLIIGFV